MQTSNCRYSRSVQWNKWSQSTSAGQFFQIVIEITPLTHIWKSQISMTISDFTSVCPSIFMSVNLLVTLLHNFKLYHNMPLIKVSWLVLRVKNMHLRPPSNIWGPWGKEKLSFQHFVIRWGKARLHESKLTSVLHHLPCVSP